MVPDQPRAPKARRQSLLWTSLLLLPILAAIWLGLNIIRVHTYDYAADYARHLGDFRQASIVMRSECKAGRVGLQESIWFSAFCLLPL